MGLFDKLGTKGKEKEKAFNPVEYYKENVDEGGQGSYFSNAHSDDGPVDRNPNSDVLMKVDKKISEDNVSGQQQQQNNEIDIDMPPPPPPPETDYGSDNSSFGSQMDAPPEMGMARQSGGSEQGYSGNFLGNDGSDSGYEGGGFDDAPPGSYTEGENNSGELIDDSYYGGSDGGNSNIDNNNNSNSSNSVNNYYNNDGSSQETAAGDSNFSGNSNPYQYDSSKTNEAYGNVNQGFSQTKSINQSGPSNNYSSDTGGQSNGVSQELPAKRETADNYVKSYPESQNENEDENSAAGFPFPQNSSGMPNSFDKPVAGEKPSASFPSDVDHKNFNVKPAKSENTDTVSSYGINPGEIKKIFQNVFSKNNRFFTEKPKYSGDEGSSVPEDMNEKSNDSKSDNLYDSGRNALETPSDSHNVDMQTGSAVSKNELDEIQKSFTRGSFGGENSVGRVAGKNVDVADLSSDKVRDRNFYSQQKASRAPSFKPVMDSGNVKQKTARGKREEIASFVPGELNEKGLHEEINPILEKRESDESLKKSQSEALKDFDNVGKVTEVEGVGSTVAEDKPFRNVVSEKELFMSVTDFRKLIDFVSSVASEVRVAKDSVERAEEIENELEGMYEGWRSNLECAEESIESFDKLFFKQVVK